jgi:hypothetical protein
VFELALSIISIRFSKALKLRFLAFAMTSFTPDASGDLGLNLIYEEATSKAPQKGKKPKKRNKYERRREKSRRVVGEKQVASTATATATATACEAQEPVRAATNEHMTVEIEAEAITSGPAPIEEVEERTPAQPQPESAEEVFLTTNELPHPPDKPITEEPAASRKTHKTTTLEDDEERAKYMAEFHARPYEMDRRSGASSRIAPSKASTHLFQDETGCAQLGLHARLTTCLTSRFHLERPTVIQQRALSALENKGDANLFVQSETGSGKTLAFLLPIIQVRESLETNFEEESCPRESNTVMVKT